MKRPASQHGMALLLAMLTVALVASFSAAAYWQQWRDWQMEQAEQQREQAAWLLAGSLDWARLILREDARASTVDHLAEPWAVPLQEARLSTFLNSQSDNTSEATPAFLSGEITDLQGRLNLRNLLAAGEQNTVSRTDLAATRKLFTALGLPLAELDRLVSLLPQTLNTPLKDRGAAAPLAPERFGQLAWLGLSGSTLQALSPHATWLPERTTLNLNTADALALYASVPDLDLAQAQQITRQRARQHFKTLDDLRTLYPALAKQWNDAAHGVTSRYFLVQGQLRLDDLTVRETSLVLRNGEEVRTLWRQRGDPATVTQTVISK